MKTISKLGIVSLVLLVFGFGCGPSYVAVSERPADPVYVRPVAPRAGYVWIDGGWYYRGGRYVHRQGYWAPPRQHYTYRPGNWDRRGNGWHWRKGGWHRR